VWQWLRSKRANAVLTFDGFAVRVAMPFIGRADLQLALDALTEWNMARMLETPLPPLYACGVRYEREPLCRYSSGHERMCEEFVTAHEVVRRGVGDCDDLGGFLCAQLRLQGEPARAIARPSAAGWHVVVMRADGTIEDPSARLGMPTS
jgi:hypothetical protein